MSKNRTHFPRLMIAGMAIAWMGGRAILNAAEEVSVLVNKPENVTPTPAGPVLPPPVKPSVPPSASAPLPVPPQAPPLANPAVKRPFMRPAVPRGMAEPKVNGAESLPVPQDAVPQNAGPQNAAPQDGRAGLALPPGVKLMPTPPIEYDTDDDARDLYRDSGKVDIVVLVQNPADGCYYQIPLSIPGCCVGQPSVAGGRGFVTGRGKVEYRWPCGFRAIVKFRQARGDVEVEYEGD